MNALPIKTFIPREINTSGKCIWCEAPGPYNKAHIIPHSLIAENNANNYLKKSVCKKCNSFFGDFEQWLIKYSVLNVYKFDKWRKVQKQTTIETLPTLIYNVELHEWLIIHSKSSAFPICQLILTSRGTLALFNEFHSKDLAAINQAIKTNVFVTDIKRELPDNFSPRAIVSKNRVIVIARNENDIKKFITEVDTNSSYNEEEPVGNGYSKSVFDKDALKSVDQLQLFFKWSKTIWSIYATKIGYEFLALLYGSDFVLGDQFVDLRRWILSHEIKKIDDIVECNTRNPSFSMPFENDHYQIDAKEPGVKTNFKAIQQPGQDILIFINNFSDTVDLEVRVGWLPPITLLFDLNLFEVPTVTTVTYEFQNLNLDFTKVCAANEKTHIVLLKDVSQDFIKKYSDYLL